MTHPSPARRAWEPRLGARPGRDGVTFRVWAPTRTRVALVVNPGLASSRERLLARADDGTFGGVFDDVGAGDLYAYVLDGDGPFPDPASRFQPQGVHGPSAVVDPTTYVWSDQSWRGVTLGAAIIYELHVGTFTPQGTFDGVTERLPYLAELGITVIELMPLADFPGSHNWGYDGVSLFAPSRAYGTPDDLRRLVDTAHGLGLAVMLDVVYNHFGPDGAYASAFCPFYMSARHQSPWGAAVNLDGEGSEHVREFFIENALHWLHEYHLDGLRLDATHGLIDDSPQHFVAELAARARISIPDRTLLLVAEDERNLASIVRRPEDGGWGLDAVWADDFHHQVRCLAAGDRDGYYEDYTGTIPDLVTTIRQGWFYQGQLSIHRGGPRGTDPAGVPLERMVICLQNHDQIGNRPFGRRLNHQIEPSLFRALSALLLFLPATPLLFMGQEWGASTRFLFFTDHNADLGRLVTIGRRAEFSRFEAFANPITQQQIPDPQARSTFADSRLNWDERTEAPHAGIFELYRALLSLRRTESALQPGGALDVIAIDQSALVVARTGGRHTLLLALCTGPGGRVDLTGSPPFPGKGRWDVVLTTDERRFLDAGDVRASAPALDGDPPASIVFSRPGAAILRGA